MKMALNDNNFHLTEIGRYFFPGNLIFMFIPGSWYLIKSNGITQS